MNIRKTFGLALTLMCALVMTSVFTACGGDDATSGTPGGDDNKPVAAVMDVTLTVGADMFRIQGKSGIQCFRPFRDSLFRNAENKVKIQVSDTCFADK